MEQDNVLLCVEDVEAVDNIDEWNGLVFLPFLYCLYALGHDNEVILVAFVVDLDLLSVSANHDDCIYGRCLMCVGGCGGVLEVWSELIGECSG